MKVTSWNKKQTTTKQTNRIIICCNIQLLRLCIQGGRVLQSNNTLRIKLCMLSAVRNASLVRVHTVSCLMFSNSLRPPAAANSPFRARLHNSPVGLALLAPVLLSLWLRVIVLVSQVWSDLLAEHFICLNLFEWSVYECPYQWEWGGSQHQNVLF